MDGIKSKINEIIMKYYKETKLPIDKVPVSGKVFDSSEIINIISAALDGWWTEGKYVSEFENNLKEFLKIKYVLTVNSGSSANLVALKTLTSRKLGNRRINKGDEVITVAAGFPTTINPIIEIGAIPVFVDIDLETYNVNIDELKKAITEKTKAIILAHTLGNPFNIKAVKDLCKEHDLWLIEDNCDALGSKYDGKYTGTFGDLATLSFYPAHHITTAEGGAVLTNNALLYKIARSIRDWGRDCWCPTGKDNTCKKRFSWKLGDLPRGYDHKYIYSELGYNLKMTDLQAAIGVAQLHKLDKFIKKRKENFKYLYEQMKEYKDYFILPKETEYSEPSWFGFPITIKDERVDRKDLLEFLNKHNVATRLLFAGNITKQPYFIDNNIRYRVVEDLKNTNIVMNKSFWIGVYPALTKEHINHAIRVFDEYFNKKLS